MSLALAVIVAKNHVTGKAVNREESFTFLIFNFFGLLT